MTKALNQFAFHPEIAEKYNLDSWDDFKDTLLTKRAGRTEPKPNANSHVRYLLDQLSKVKNPLRSSVRVGLMMFEGKCYLCGKTLIDDTNGNKLKIEADHVVSPMSGGGTTQAGNILLTHGVCNNKKGNQPIEDILGSDHPYLEILSDFQKLYDYKPLAPEAVQEIIAMVKAEQAIFEARTMKKALKILSRWE